MKKAVYQLQTLTCPSCVKKIQTALGRVNGVSAADVLFNSSKVKIEFDEEKVSADELQDIIDKLGFQVLSIKV